MRGDEVDAGPGFATAAVEAIGRGGQPRRHRRLLGRIAFPIGPDGITEFIIPLGPAGGETADLIAAGTDIPGFGDQLGGRENRILQTALQKTMRFVEAMLFTRQYRAEIE